MRILLDTNVLIPLEDLQILNKNIAKITQLANKHGCCIIYHPSSLKDINNDKNDSRRKLLLSKLRKYNILESPPPPNADFFRLLGTFPNRQNDMIDNELLFAVYRNCVNFLVTEDKQIHRKARILGIDARVYYVEQCIDALGSLYEKTPITMPNIHDVPIHNLPAKDSIFNSLKEDYPGFEEWFNKISREGRKAWVMFKGSGEIGAICIYKEEPNDGTIPLQVHKLLKLCTFKVDNDFRGRKVGELFFKAAFNYCLHNHIPATYLTVFADKQPTLVNLCQDFGFKSTKFGNEGEVAYYRSFLPPNSDEEDLSSIEFHIKHYPFYRSGSEIGKFIIPVIPTYHELLFPDCQKQLSLFNPNEAVNNGILKAYICNSKITQIKEGDLVLFYRSRDWQAVTTLGIVELVVRSNDPEEVASMVGKRTVYTIDNIREMCKNETLILLFRQIQHINSGLSYKKLKDKKIINNHLETITRIADDGFKLIMTNQ